MELSERSIERFRAAYREAYGVDVSVDEVRQMALRVMLLYEMLAKPLPAAATVRAQEEAPRTGLPHAET